MTLFDHYDPWQPPSSVDEFQRALVLSAYSPGTEIVDIRSYRPGEPGYHESYPYCVRVRRPSGQESVCVLKAGPLIGGVEREGRLLPALAELGLAVPAVLAGPVEHPDYPCAGALVVLSELPGEPLPWIDVTLQEADLTCRLHRRAIARLHGLTEPLLRHKIAPILPQRTLLSELEDVIARGGPWLSVPLFAQTVRRLRPILKDIHTPLVFTNGDYNPLNFLHEGEQLTGWLDFTDACFEDPYAGLAKFLIWGFDRLGWGTGVQVGLVERFLYQHGVTRTDFAPRLALRCLYRLQRDTSVSGEQDQFYRQEILKVLDSALEDLGEVGVFTIGTFAIIFDKQDRVLLCHRRDLDLWNLPGGGVESGELPTEATVREVKEETGLNLAIERLVGVYGKVGKDEIVFAFGCRAVGGQLTISDEADQHGYFELDNIPRNTLPKHVERIKDALRAGPQPVFRRQTAPSTREHLRTLQGEEGT